MVDGTRKLNPPTGNESARDKAEREKFLTSKVFDGFPRKIWRERVSRFPLFKKLRVKQSETHFKFNTMVHRHFDSGVTG